MNADAARTRIRSPKVGLIRWRRWLRPFLSRHGSPEEIAGGAALGFAIAFTPTIGIQLLMAYFIATSLRVSRAAALIPIWITTPVTAPPIYTFTYMIGQRITGGPSPSEARDKITRLVRQIDEHDTFDLAARLREALSLGNEIYWPMMLGGLLVGGVAALLAYPITLHAVRRFRTYRENRRNNRKKRRFSLRLRQRPTQLTSKEKFPPAE